MHRKGLIIFFIQSDFQLETCLSMETKSFDRLLYLWYLHEAYNQLEMSLCTISRQLLTIRDEPFAIALLPLPI